MALFSKKSMVAHKSIRPSPIRMRLYMGDSIIDDKVKFFHSSQCG